MPIDIKGREEKRDFGQYEEEMIISFMFDQPEYFTTVMPYIKDTHFKDECTKLIYGIISDNYEKHGVMLSRDMCIDILKNQLTAEDPFEKIFKLIKNKLPLKEAPIIRNRLYQWAKKMSYYELYSKRSIQAWENENYEAIDEIIEKAKKVVDFQGNPMFFFDNYDELFNPESEVKLTTGFQRLDSFINSGGPIRGDVLSFLAPTGSGKSILLVNVGAAAIQRGLNVLHVTLELSKLKTAQRYLGCFTEQPIASRFDENTKSKMIEKMQLIKAASGKMLVIDEYPPNDITTDHIQAKLDYLRRVKGLSIDVVIIDYLELLEPRKHSKNDNEYLVQKDIASDVCRLAKIENVLVFTAFQTNRGGGEDAAKDSMISLNRIAESYGKSMSVDYIVSLNRIPGGMDKNSNCCKINFYIAKNRNGPQPETIQAYINFGTMKVKEFTS